MSEVYIVIEEFSDKNGQGGVYQAGELYPAVLNNVDSDRVKVLMGKNKYKRPFIKRLTNAEVKKILEERNIEYESDANREKLISLLK